MFQFLKESERVREEDCLGLIGTSGLQDDSGTWMFQLDLSPSHSLLPSSMWLELTHPYLGFQDKKNTHLKLLREKPDGAYTFHSYSIGKNLQRDT